jgi:hypothetical protein
MALQKQVVPVEIATGIDTKTDPKKVTGKLLALVNAIFQEAKALRKRFGYLSLPQSILSGSSIASGATISPYQNELVELDGKNLYSYSDQQSKWINKGSLPVCSISTNSIVKNSRGQTTQDQALHSSGFQVFTWEDTAGGSFYSVVDTGTGQTIVNSVQLSATAYMAKPMAVGNFVAIFYYDSSSTSLKYQAINMSTPNTIGSAVTVASSLYITSLAANTCTYDVCLIGTSLYIVYNLSTGYNCNTLSSTLSLSSAHLLTGSGPNVAAFTEGTNLWIAWYDLTNIKAAIFSSSFTTVLASTLVENVGALGDAYYSTHNITGIVIGTAATIFYESDQQARFLAGHLDFFYGNYIRQNTITLTGTVGTPSNVIRSLGIASKPFNYNGTIYMLAVYDAERKSYSNGTVYDQSTESTYFVVDSSGNLLSKVAQLNGGGISKKFIAPEFALASTGNYQLSYLFKDILESQLGVVFTQTGVNSLDLSFTSVYPSKLEIGKVLLLGGGSLYQYDGAIPTELNFHLYPELMTYQVGSVSGALGIGLYEYQSTYEWTDNQGQLNRSATSDAINVVVANPQISVQTSSSTTLLANTGTTSNPNASFSTMDVGFLVTGTGIPANTTITGFAFLTGPIRREIFISNAATTTTTETNLTVTPQFAVTGSATDLFNTMSINQITSFPLSAFTSQDTNHIYASDISNLLVGMTLQDNGNRAVNGTITSIDPLTRELGGVVSLGGAGSSVTRAYKQFSGTFTNGSATVTGVPAAYFPLFIVGQTAVTVTGATSIQIAGFNSGAGTVTLTSNYTGPTGADQANINMPAGIYLKSGQAISGTGIPANTFIQTVSTSFPATTTITISNNATSSQGSSFIITNLYDVQISVPTIRATNKNSVSIALWRTQSNLTTLFRSTSISNPIINDRTKDFAFISDQVSDFDIIGNDELYTNGGEVDNTAPPASSMITTYKNRAVLIPDESLLSWWYSKQVIPGSPVEFSGSFVQNIDSRGGDMTACAAMDDKLILFKIDNIFYVVGEGPTPAGTQNDFSEPQLISTDCGCDNPASIVLTPDGLMFQSTKGIYLLARNMSVQYIGAPVEAFTEVSTVTSAVLLDEAYEVRFTMSNGQALVYDYYFQQWSVFTNISGVDACIYNGIYNYLTSAGLVNQETPNAYTDNGSFIQMSLTTSWMSLAGLQGFQRVWRMLVLGQYKSPHTLQVNVATDFATSFEQNVSIPVTSNPGLYQYRVHMKQQKCEAIQFQIQDSQSSSFGEGLQLSEITLEVGIKVGADKLSAGRSF